MTWKEQLNIGIGYDIDMMSVNRDEFQTSDDLLNALQAQANPNSILLAHMDDGVIWGYVDDGQLLLSTQADTKISPVLRPQTLQQLWLFDDEFEFHLWSDGINWLARRVTEIDDVNSAILEEKHLLWGTLATPQKYGFTMLEDGVQGLKHLPPSRIFGRGNGPILRDRVYLKIRHYLTSDEKTGVNRITLSRLVGIGQLNHG